MIRFLKRRIANAVLSHLLSAIIEEDVVPLKDLSPGERRLLSEEARGFLASSLWRRLVTTTKRRAQDKMFRDSACWEDMFFGKAALYVVDLWEKRVSAISNLRNLSDE